MEDVSKWYTDQQVSGMLGYSIRTLDRMAKKDEMPHGRLPVPGRKPQRVWDPEAVDARMPPKHAKVMPEESQEVSRPISPIAPAMTELAESPEITWPAILELIQAAVSMSAPPPTPALWVTIAEAAQITGLTPTLLRRLAKEGAIPALKDGAVKIRREVLAEIDFSALLKPKKRKARR